MRTHTSPSSHNLASALPGGKPSQVSRGGFLGPWVRMPAVPFKFRSRTFSASWAFNGILRSRHPWQRGQTGSARNPRNQLEEGGYQCPRPPHVRSRELDDRPVANLHTSKECILCMHAAKFSTGVPKQHHRHCHRHRRRYSPPQISLSLNGTRGMQTWLVSLIPPALWRPHPPLPLSFTCVAHN